MVSIPKLWQNVSRHWRKLALVGGALFLTLAVFVFAQQLQARYFQHNTYFYDPAYYLQYNLSLLERVHSEGRLSVAWDELVHNGRHPLRTIPIALFAPHWLGQPFGFLATILPTLALLLGLFGYTIYQRSQSLWLTSGGMALLASVPIFFDVNRGIANYWLEWGATLWLGVALLCLWNIPTAKRSQLMWWWAGFGVAAASAMLSRYIAGVFVFTACAPVYLYSLWSTWRADKRWQTVVQAVLVSGCVLGVLAGYFAIAHLDSNIEFYQTYGYALNQTFEASRDFVLSIWGILWKLPFSFQPYLIGLGVITVGVAVATVRLRSLVEWLVALASAAAVPVTLIAMGTVYAFHPIVYAIMPTLCFVLIPRVVTSKQRWQMMMLTVMGVCALFVAGITYGRTTLSIKEQSQAAITGEKQFISGLMDNLATVPGDIHTWQAYFEEYSDIPTLEFYYGYQRFVKPAGQYLFYSQISAWKGDYPDATDEQIAEDVYNKTVEQVDVAVTFADPDQGRLNGWMLNQTSRFVSGYVARRMQTDPNFKQVFRYENNFYGTLVGYQNLTR